ncbi:hypothetical protein NQ318_019930 [Aromia moschata]|uniref:BEN domain-containing protein n=1 Tax=Aromia moschata TaxID=1265417 RepID=A0AAV8Y9C3_9CUCU|nr:hypothetical protein NQ318_019930 [Aromia moschata]
MANVPTRQLDLSIIELPKNAKKCNEKEVHLVNIQHELDKDKENELPKTYREFLETQKKDHRSRQKARKKLPENDSSPTNKDLLKIIAQQNEQLLILQKQVAMLLNRDQTSQPKQIEGGYGVQCSPKGRYVGENCTTSTQNENFRMPHQDTSSPRKRGMSKFSIDLMTSFEVAIRPQHKQNFANYEPKIQEVTESESVATGTTDRNERTVVDTSLHLQEPVKVREICPSPEPSININMNDYDSSEDALRAGEQYPEKSSGADERRASLSRNRKKNVCPEKAKNTTMSRVKEATLKHLRNIGVTVGPMDDCDDFLNFENDSREYSPTEVSFAVKQILMKYLPDDHLTKITWKKTQSAPINANVAKPGIIPSRPEFSFASVQYMKKYNLLPNTDPRPKELGQIPKTASVERVAGPKILDITALKMQPKLL